MIKFILISRNGTVETFEFENVFENKQKCGTIDRATDKMNLDSGSLGYPAEDSRLFNIMLNEKNLEVGDRGGCAFG